MYCKICPNCYGDSYSSSPHFTWICPYCGKDITREQGLPAGSPLVKKILEEVKTGQEKLIKK